MKKEQKITGSTFFYMALYAFLGLGMEMLILTLEQQILGFGLKEFSNIQNIMHWVITCVIWVVFAYVLVRASKNKYQYDVLNLGKEETISPRNWIFAGLLVAVCIGVNAFDWGTLKILGEFARKSPLIFASQYIYYAVEVILVLLIVVFGQRAGALWFHSANVPWGGITVGLTWGLVHALTKGDITIGLAAMFAGVLYGCIYLLLKKKTIPAYLLILLAFAF